MSVDVFQSSIGRRILGNRRIAHFTGRRRAFRWGGRGARGGQLFARLRTVAPGGRADVRRVALVRRGGRFHRRPAFYRRASCGAIASFKLERPVFGGRSEPRGRRHLPARGDAGARRSSCCEDRAACAASPRTRVRLQGRAHRVRIAVRGTAPRRLPRARHGPQRRRTTVATLTARRL